MSREQLAVIIVFAYFLVFFSLIFFFSNRWSKKHCVYVVLYYERDVSPDLMYYLCKTRAKASAFVQSYCRFGNVTLVGVYSFVPDSYLKEFGGLLSRKK